MKTHFIPATAGSGDIYPVLVGAKLLDQDFNQSQQHIRNITHLFALRICISISY